MPRVVLPLRWRTSWDIPQQLSRFWVGHRLPLVRHAGELFYWRKCWTSCRHLICSFAQTWIQKVAALQTISTNEFLANAVFVVVLLIEWAVTPWAINTCIDLYASTRFAHKANCWFGHAFPHIGWSNVNEHGFLIEFVLMRDLWVLWTYRVCQYFSLGWEGWGQKEGRQNCCVLWNPGVTLGRKVKSMQRTASSLWNVRSSCFIVTALSSEIRLADVTDMRKMVFIRSHFSGASLMGSNDGLVRADRTGWSCQVEHLCVWGGCEE